MFMLDKWLERSFLIKTFDKLDECDVIAIRALLDDANEPDGTITSTKG